MIRGFILTLLAAALILAGYLFYYLGYYKPVQITIEDRPAMHLLFKNHLGAYHGIGNLLQEVESWTMKSKIDCPKTFGEFEDDPQAVDQDRLRSRAGCVLNLPVTGDTAPYLQETRAARTYVVARFEGAPGIGPFKVYPKVQDYFQEQRLKSAGAVIEVYSVNGSQVTTEFLFPAERP